mgnify:CR=1 FL=1
MAIGTSCNAFRLHWVRMPASDQFRDHNTFMAGFVRKPWGARDVTNRVNTINASAAEFVCYNVRTINLDAQFFQSQPFDVADNTNGRDHGIELVGFGLSADLDVRRAAADLARTRAQRGALELQQTRALNALAVLLGRTPGAPIALLEDAGARDSDALQLGYVAEIEIGEPARLIQRRPDLRAAEARLIAATADVGVQAAELYPSLRLPGSVSTDLEDGLSDGLTASLGAVLDIPLLDFGRREAELTAAEAQAAEAALAYQNVVLGALEEVETGLVAIESVQDRLDDLGVAVAEGERAYDQLNALYREGLASFIDVLDAQRTLIGNREALVDTQADLALAVIELNLALAAPTGQGG